MRSMTEGASPRANRLRRRPLHHSLRERSPSPASRGRIFLRDDEGRDGFPSAAAERRGFAPGGTI